MHKNINELLESLNLEVNSSELYELSFTHSSFNIDAKTSHHDYERLEFVGDSVINFVVADLAYSKHQEMSQGDLSKLRAFIVQSSSLAEKAKKYNFNEYIRLGHSLPENTRNTQRILEDVFEAFIGAMYYDKGIDFTYNFVKELFKDDVDHFNKNQLKDYKSELQEEMQAEHRESVKYKLVEELGLPHDRTFVVEVLYEDTVLGRGQGKTKKAAEQMAALDALRKKAK